MKKTLFIAVAMALLAPWTMRVQAQGTCTQTVTASQPFVEGFEGITGSTYSTASSLPACWNGFSNGTDFAEAAAREAQKLQQQMAAVL